MTVDIKSIKRLKDLTGVGLTDAKIALVDAKGDFDKALSAMRKKGLTKAEKRSEREARSGIIGSYNHDGRIGVLVEVNCETDFVAKNDLFKELVKDLSMQIAASNPAYLSYNDVPKADINKIKSEFESQTNLSSKSEKVRQSIIDGQLSKYFGEKCLLDQPFIKDPEKTVSQLVKEYAARLGENIIVRRYSRIALGEKL